MPMHALLQHLRYWTRETRPATGGANLPGRPDPSVIRLPQATPRLLLGLLACYPLLILLGYQLLPGTSGPAAIWPADAALFLAFLTTPARLWGTIAVAATLVDFACGPFANWLAIGQGMDWQSSLGYALAHLVTSLGPVLAAHGLQRVAGFDPQLVESPAWLLVVVAGVVPGSILGVLELSSRIGITPSVPTITVWALSTALALLLFAPALAIGFDDARGQRDGAPGTAIEAALVAALAGAIVAWHGQSQVPGLAQLPTLMLLVFPVSWLALRFSRRVVFMAVPAVAYLLAYLGAHAVQLPAGAQEAWPIGTVGAQLSLLAICGAALLVSHVVHHQRRLLAALERERGRLRWYASQLDRTEADARQRIAAELHDGIAQALTGQRLLLTALRPKLTGADAAEVLAGAEAASAEAQSHVRALLQELRPAELEARSLRELVKRTTANFTGRYPFRVECADLPANELPAATLGLLFQALRELLFNAYHHSRGTCAHIAGHVAQDWVRLEVHDDGVGFSSANVGRRAGSRGLGLVQLFERIESAGGSVELGVREGVASLVIVSVPVHLREPPAP